MKYLSKNLVMRAISTNIIRRCKIFFSASKRCNEWFLVEIRDVRICGGYITAVILRG